ncbi:hypothetical protein [Rugamonas sp.]|uniref:hypothetical protein n=1 Tax=Rugamonas sp. TaxID=1926287 RepID=UPI0025DECD8F|nr:hypothetical protein [Rugamonas sp.]
MNEYAIATQLAITLAALTSILAVSIRLVLSKYRPSSYSTDFSIEIYEHQRIDVKNYEISRATGHIAQYTKPNFKKNNLEEDQISRSFKIDTMVPLDDLATEMGLHAAGLANSYFIE